MIRDYEFDPRSAAKDGLLHLDVADVEKALVGFRAGGDTATGSAGWDSTAALPWEGAG